MIRRFIYLFLFLTVFTNNFNLKNRVFAEEERILNFSANLEYRGDSNFLVKESVSFIAEGKIFKLALMHYLDNVLAYENLGQIPVYELREVKVNNKLSDAKAYNFSTINSYLINSNAQVPLIRGVNDYSFSYEVSKAVITGDDFLKLAEQKKDDKYKNFAERDYFVWSVNRGILSLVMENVQAKIIIPSSINSESFKVKAYLKLKDEYDYENVSFEYAKIDDKTSSLNYKALVPLKPKQELIIFFSLPKDVLKTSLPPVPKMGRTLKITNEGVEAVATTTPKQTGKTIKVDGTEVLKNVETGKTVKIDGTEVLENVETGKTLKVE